MPRTLYTVAVVSKAPAEEVAAVLAEGADGCIVRAEEMVHTAAMAPFPLVAFYRVLMDGWNRTHLDVHALGAGTLWPQVSADLEYYGWWMGTGDFEELTSLPKPREANDYAVLALIDAMLVAASFSRTTGCRIVLLCRVLHGAFGDDEFRKV